MSADDQPVRQDRRRAGLAVQIGQTLLVIGAVLLVVGLALGSGEYTFWMGLVLVVVGLPLSVVGLRGRRGPGG